MEQQLYDLTSLEKFAGGNIDFITNMIELFITSAPEDLKTMEIALEKKDYSSISSIAHRIKPSINYMCIDRLFEDIRSVEAWEEEDHVMIKKTTQIIADLSLAIIQLKRK